ncbi:MAG: hypothetical protein SFV32_02520 [Opitutaceae bacterium]|nr:hypothetical protein [Opitutaceae bacterium]
MTSLLFLTTVVTAQENISTDSPFLPIGGAVSPSESANTPSGPVEFCGTLQIGGKVVYGLYDTVAQKGRWLSLNEPEDGWAIRSFDAVRRQLSVEINGQSHVLSLREPRFEGATQQAQPVQPAPVAAPPAVNPADEAARLKAVAEEIRRRRTLRQKQQGQPLSGAATQGQP